MKVLLTVVLLLLFSIVNSAQYIDSRQIIPVQYEEITSFDFPKAVELSGEICILPFGILEKHGPHLPLGTDLLDSREIAKRAALKEYSVIFPQYYVGQIYEAKHQPGTIAYSHETVWNLLQETCDELSRNGFKKIIIVNGHGGNNNFLRYFCQAQLEKRRDYAVVLFTPISDIKTDEQVQRMRKTKLDGHAGETETSTMMAHRSDIVKIEDANKQDGRDQNRLSTLKDGFTGIWWYAKYPNHYSGDGSPANNELGDIIINSKTEQLVELIRELKHSDDILKLQKLFFDDAEKPLNTNQ